VGEWIVHFIIVSHQLVTHPQDIINKSGHFAQLLQYSEAPDTPFFLVCASTLHSPTGLCALRADCTESDGVHTDFAESVCTPHGLCMTLGGPCGLRTKIALSKN
jgi:hypothetical protein